jgi:hypothetical protein
VIVVRYAVCSERESKPVTRVVCDTRSDAEREMERFRQEDGGDPSISYWMAELGPECEAWRWLARATEGEQTKGTAGI